MNQDALSYAKQQEELFRKQMSDYYTNLAGVKTEQETQANLRKQQLLDTINRSQQPIEQQYGDATRQAYINKMMGERRLDQDISRMGLDKSMYGIEKSAQLESGYGQTLSGLQRDKANMLGELDAKRLDVESEYGQDISKIGQSYLESKMNLDKYGTESGRNIYDKAYQNFIDQQRYNDSLKQQQFENNMANKQFNFNVSESKKNQPTNMISANNTNLTWKAGGWDANQIQVQMDANGNRKYIDTVTGKTATFKPGQNPFTGKINRDLYDPVALKAGKKIIDPNRVAGNGYQPTYIGNTKLVRSGYTATVGGASQNVWKAGSNNYIWDGKTNEYIKVKNVNGIWTETK